MALSREERKLLHQKAKQPTFGVGKPSQNEGNNGDITFRKIEGSGTVEYVKENGSWVAVASSGEMPAVRLVGGSGGGSSSSSSHGSLGGLSDDDHTQYILVNGTRAFTGAVTVGSDGAGHDVTFHSGTGSDLFFWDASAEKLTITGTNAQTALDIADGNVTISDNLDVGGTTYLDALIVGADGSGEDVKIYGTTSGDYIEYDSGSNELILTNDNSIVFKPSDDDSATISPAANGVLNITTVDAAAAAANIVITADGTLDLNSVALDIDASGAVTLDGATVTIKGTGASKYGDDTATLDFNGSGAVSETGMTSFSITPSGAITLTAGAASTWSTTSGALTITSASAATWSSSAGNLTIDSAAGSLVLDGHTGAQLTSSNAGEVDITSAAAVDINAATFFSIDGADNSSITVTGSNKDIDISVAGGSTQELRLASAGTGSSAIHLNASAGGINIDSNDMITIDAADEITIDTNSADGHIAITSFHTAGQSILISANQNIGSILDIDAGIIDIDVQDTINIDAADEIEIATGSADGHITLQSAHTAGLALHLRGNADAASEVQIDAGILDIDVTGAATIDAVGVAIGAGSGELDLTTSGTLDINSVALDIDASGAITIDSTSTILISGDGGATFSDDTEAIIYDGSGNLDIDSVALDIDASGAVTMDTTSSFRLIAATAASFYLASNTASTTTLLIDAANAHASNVSNVDINADGTVSIDGTVGITIGTASDKPIDIDSSTLDIDASGAITIDSSAASITMEVVDGQTVKIGKSSHLETIWAPHGTAGSEKWTTTNASGTAADAIGLVSSSGGITLNANLDVLIAAVGNDITFQGASSKQLKFTHDPTDAGDWKIANQTAGKQIDISSGSGITMDGYAQSLSENYQLHIGSASVNNFYTHGEADLKQNYSMLSYQWESSADTFEATY